MHTYLGVSAVHPSETYKLNRLRNRDSNLHLVITFVKVTLGSPYKRQNMESGYRVRA